jgi:hypothetical protein
MNQYQFIARLLLSTDGGGPVDAGSGEGCFRYENYEN